MIRPLEFVAATVPYELTGKGVAGIRGPINRPIRARKPRPKPRTFDPNELRQVSQEVSARSI